MLYKISYTRRALIFSIIQETIVQLSAVDYIKNNRYQSPWRDDFNVYYPDNIIK